ncbi:hypothetical protein ACWEWL_12820 [Streptomyces rochei]|uniref:Transposase n=1 Tax=Streptomyces vinaceusdrappus TaxID=67376 RepID=A0ABY6C218_9ACTN|nr:hypothetical protein [Streptomyces vinaceusdrappus]UXI82043.1 hypothetical protein N6Q81_30340 [Streptomyces vinaceusdrappus]
MAARLSAWLVQAEAAQAAKPARKQVKAVRDWVRALTDELRGARFKPFADQSGQIWRLLCERSSVSLVRLGSLVSVRSGKSVFPSPWMMPTRPHSAS